MAQDQDGIPNLEELIWVEDLRSRQRFIVRRPLSGELGGEHADIRDLSSGGFRIAHRMHVRIGEQADLKVLSESGEIPFRTKVVWSRLSDNRDNDEALLYTSGMRIEEDQEHAGEDVDHLVHSHCTPDTTSMETKRMQALERLMKRMTVEREILHDLDPAALLRSYQALGTVSRMGGEEKAALIQGAKERLALESRPSAWNRDVLAAWESIDGSVELETIEAARKILLELDRFVDEHDD